MRAIEGQPMNFGFLGKGNSAILYTGRADRGWGLWFETPRGLGTTPQAIDTCQTVADETDTQVAIHTDSE